MSHARHSRVPRTPTRATLAIHEFHGLPHEPRSSFTSPTDSHTSHARQSRVPRTPTRVTLAIHESHGLPHEPRSSFTSPTDSHTSHARHSRVPRTPTRATLDTPESHGLLHEPSSSITSPTDSHTSLAEVYFMLQFHETNTLPVESGHEREVVSQTAHTVRSVVAVVVPQTSRACVQSYNAGLPDRAALTVSTARETRVHPCQLGPRPQLAQLSRFV